MSRPDPSQQPSPELFFETVNAYQRTACLKAAVELGIFTAIGEGAATPEAIGAHCGASPRGVRTVCDYLVTIAFLTKQGGRYGLTPDAAAFLDRRSPAYLGGAIDFLLSPELTEGFTRLTEAVRKGGTAVGDQGTIKPENPLWVKFARAMAPMMALPAELIAQKVGAASAGQWKVLDIAAGHGLFGLAIARVNPKAEIVALDWAGVLEVAKGNAAAAGVAGRRYRAIAGDVFTADFGGGYDLVLLTNLLHHFDPAGCERVLRKVHAALAPRGRTAILEFVPNDDRVSPPVPAQFSLMMLAGTPAGDAYTYSEFQEMLRKADFARSEIHPLPPTFFSLIISER